MALSKITNSGIGAIDTLAVDTNTLYVDSTNNRVGVGTSSPTLALDVRGESVFGSGTDGVKLTYSAGNSTGIIDTGFTSTGLEFRTGNNFAAKIDSSGNVLVGTTVPVASATNGVELTNSYIRIRGAGTGVSSKIDFYNANGRVGYIYTSGTSTGYNTTSDYRLKENVTADWDATTRLKQLNPVRFNFIADADVTVDGFLAHEVQDIVPEAISGTKDAMRDEEYEVTPAVLDDDGNEVTPAVMGTRSVPDYQGIDQSKLVPLLVKTIQELEARIVALETA